MGGGIVPAGTLAHNNSHPKPERTAQARLSAVRLSLGRLILRIVDAEQGGSLDVVQDDNKTV